MWRAIGNLTRNTAPASGALTADICPLCASTRVRAMESPMPIPSALAVKNGSNTSFSLSAGIPGPRSDIESSAKFSTREVRRLTMRFLPGVPDIASIALTTRFGMTC